MKNYACIAVGINQYEFLEPLSYAQQDAETLHGFLVNKTNFLAEQCLLLSDNISAPIWEQPSYPSRDNILDLIENFCQNQLTAENFLWYFFSGYGTSYKSQDYLIPIDGNPQQLEGTGISIRKLLENLKKSPVAEVLVILDIKHSHLIGMNNQFGTQTVELAKELEIPLLLSYSNSNEVSSETSALRLGCFTAALLEGLSLGQCTIIKNLDNFLSNRLPELCTQYFQPKQNSLMIVNPPEKINQIIVPEKIQVDDSSSLDKLGLIVNSLESSTKNKKVSNSVTKSLSSDNTKIDMVNGNQNQNTKTNNNRIQDQENSQNNITKVEMSENISQNISSDRYFLPKLIAGSSLTSLALLLGVFLTNKSIFMGEKVVAEGNLSPINTEENTSSEVNLSPSPVVSSSSSSEVNLSPSPVVSSSEIEEPTTSPNLNKDSKKQEKNQPLPNQIPNQKILSEAVTLLDSVSASSLSQAIIKASQIPQNDPLYPQAQNQIERWSLTILDIANGRALKGNHSNAINAAKLVPRNIKPIYQEAQLAIGEWEQQVAKQNKSNEDFNVKLINSAKEMIQPGQASSYIKAINEARKISSGESQYEEAQKLINQWSNTIFSIAKVRAKNNNLSEAILAVELVPYGTPSYESAQKALSDWKKQQKTKKPN
ncbi:MAG: caspase domain-containing protein [Trichodesmium sp.]